MPWMNPMSRTLHFHLLYWGPEGAGRRTSMDAVAGHFDQPKRGRGGHSYTIDEVTCEVATTLAPVGGCPVWVTLHRVAPGSDRVATLTRVAASLDAVVFVADSQRARVHDDAAALDELFVAGVGALPRVLQLNKRDLPALVSLEEGKALFGRGSVAAVASIATARQGALAAFELAIHPLHARAVARR